jgi:hypothetical protein
MKKIFYALLAVIGEGWGTDGHRTVAAIAEALLSDTARKAVGTILPSHESLVSVATWADEVGHTPEYIWSKCMHYVDTEECSLGIEAEDCECCVISAISNYTARVSDQSLSIGDRLEALKFLTHFVGDASQPLHAGHTHDRGGNLVHVTIGWSGHTKSETNLHTVWDSSLIEHMLHLKSWHFQTFAENLVNRMKSGEFPVSEWETDCDGSERCPVDSSEESAQMACEFAYTDELGRTVETGSTLSSGYYETRIAVIEKRIAAAGVRLASILNNVIDKKDELDDEMPYSLPEVEII